MRHEAEIVADEAQKIGHAEQKFRKTKNEKALTPTVYTYSEV